VGQSFAAFVREHRGLSRADFLARVDAPHALCREAPVPGAQPTDSGFLTRRIDSEAILKARDEARVLPIRKADRNSFAHMITVGRAANNDVVVEHTAVSKFHAYFQRGPAGELTIQDADSSNGTSVEGVQLEARSPVRVQSGTVVVLGGAVQLEVLEPEDLYERVRVTGERLSG